MNISVSKCEIFRRSKRVFPFGLTIATVFGVQMISSWFKDSMGFQNRELINYGFTNTIGVINVIQRDVMKNKYLSVFSAHTSYLFIKMETVFVELFEHNRFYGELLNDDSGIFTAWKDMMGEEFNGSIVDQYGRQAAQLISVSVISSKDRILRLQNDPERESKVVLWLRETIDSMEENSGRYIKAIYELKRLPKKEFFQQIFETTIDMTIRMPESQKAKIWGAVLLPWIVNGMVVVDMQDKSTVKYRVKEPAHSIKKFKDLPAFQIYSISCKDGKFERLYFPNC